MCGLAGVAGNTSVKIRDAFIDLLTITQLRGNDATGVFTVGNNDAVKYAKDVGPPNNLFDRKSFDAVMHGVPKIMAGHCRAKTIGDNNKDNAHPYDFDNVIGMHNGTLRSYHSMEGYDYKRTDSYALYHNIDRYGAPETIKDVNPEGAWALVWWDKVDNRLMFLRNDKRPLWFAWTKAKDAVFWCSEPWMFSAVSRHVELWDGTEEGKEPVSPYFQLPPNMLWSFTVNGYVKPNERYLTFHQPREVKAEGKEPVGFSIGSPNRGGEVTNPFTQREAAEGAYQRFMNRRAISQQSLDDPIEDNPPVESTSTTPTVGNSKKTSSNVLDFRLGLKRSQSSEKNTLSLRALVSRDSQQSSSESGTNGSQESSKKGSTLTCLPDDSPEFRRQVSLRNVVGTTYITHNGSGAEIPLAEFEARTGGKCSFCKQPIGDLSEVAAFTDRAMSGFICMSCVEEPALALVG